MNKLYLSLAFILISSVLMSCGKAESAETTEPTKSEVEIAFENVVEEHDYYIDSLGIVHFFTLVQNNSDKTLDIEYTITFYKDGKIAGSDVSVVDNSFPTGFRIVESLLNFAWDSYDVVRSVTIVDNPPENAFPGMNVSTNFYATKIGSFLSVIGKNISERNISPVDIIVLFYDKDEKLVTSGMFHLDSTVPGQIVMHEMPVLENGITTYVGSTYCYYR